MVGGVPSASLQGAELVAAVASARFEVWVVRYGTLLLAAAGGRALVVVLALDPTAWSVSVLESDTPVPPTGSVSSACVAVSSVSARFCRF